MKSIKGTTWEVEDYQDRVVLYGWGLDRDSNSCLIRIEDFPAMCYLKLPPVINDVPMLWNDQEVKQFFNSLKTILGPYSPFNYLLKYSETIYYYQKEKKHPMLQLAFSSLKNLNKTAEILAVPHHFNDWGFLELVILEDKIPHLRKFLTMANIQITGWFELPNKLAVEKLSTLEHEYVVSWKDIRPIEQNVSAGWVVHPKIISLDIETYCERKNSFPDKNAPANVVFIISVVYQKLGLPESRKKYCLVQGNCTETENITLKLVQNEVEFFTVLAELIHLHDPDILTGYNILGFDYAYLQARLKLLKLPWPQLGRLKNSTTKIRYHLMESKSHGSNQIHKLQASGRVNLDLLPFIRKNYKLNLYGLDFVGKHFMGIGKNDMTANRMYQIYEQSQAGLAEASKNMKIVADYCVQDSVLVLDLIEKLDVWTSLVEEAAIKGINVFDLLTRGQQHGCLSQIYDFASREGIVLSNRIQVYIDSEGGMVREPEKGIFDNAIILDFTSLYPSIIRAYNICYTTLVPDHLDVPDNDCHVIEFKQEESRNGRKVSKKYKFRWYKNRKGILPKLVDELIKERNKIKALLKITTDPYKKKVLQCRQQALKTSANSIYGMLGSGIDPEKKEGSKRSKGMLPLNEASTCITAIGRQQLVKVNSYVNSLNLRTLYNDTDSSIIASGCNTAQEARILGESLAERISAMMPEGVNFALESVVKILLIAKKRYSFYEYDQEGKFIDRLHSKGDVLVRRDYCTWHKKLHKSIVENLMKDIPLYTSLYQVIYAIEQLIENKIEVEDLSVVKKLGKEYKQKSYPLNVYANYLREIGRNPQTGDRLQYVVVKSIKEQKQPKAKMLLGEKMRPIDVYKSNLSSEPIDINHYLEKVLMNSMDQLFMLGYGKELDRYQSVTFRKTNRHKPVNLFTPIKMLSQMYSVGKNIREVLKALKPKIKLVFT
jgi:DNA polymerase delta subunit 1